MKIRPEVVRGKLRGGVKLLIPESLQQAEQTFYRYPAPRTELRLHVAGLGDQMMARQLGHAFAERVRDRGDPGLGDVTLALGATAPYLDVTPGDVTLYWWYSSRLYEDDPAAFLDGVVGPRLDPDVVLCGSRALVDLASDAGYDTLYFPIGVEPSMYRPLGLDRAGLGYAGSKGHKADADVDLLMGPYLDRPDFEWVSDLATPEQLNLWYNTRLVTFGLTEPAQREWGVVNSRVFETLASGTPFVLHEHPTVEEVLGFRFPYQASTREEAVALVDEITADPEAALDRFDTYRERVHADHSYGRRLEDLVAALT